MRKQTLYRVLAALSLGGYGWLGWSYASDNQDASTPSVCLFKLATHLPCPSCGVTRALLYLTKGDIRGCLLTNPLGLLLGLALVIVPSWVLIDTFRRSDSLFRWYRKGEGMMKGWVSVVATILVALNWLWNIGKGL